MEQLLVGVLLAAPLIALLPTLLAFVALLAAAHHAAALLQALLRTLLFALNSSPICAVALWALQPLVGPSVLPVSVAIMPAIHMADGSLTYTPALQQRWCRCHASKSDDANNATAPPSSRDLVGMPRLEAIVLGIKVPCAHYVLSSPTCSLQDATSPWQSEVVLCAIRSWHQAGGLTLKQFRCWFAGM